MCIYALVIVKLYIVVCIYALVIVKFSESLPWGWRAANLLVFKRVREALGFQRCKVFAVGAAPTRMETYEYFMSVNIPLMNFYGKMYVRMYLKVTKVSNDDVIAIAL